jgi:O-antigen/teichoic acid export membrane protein
MNKGIEQRYNSKARKTYYNVSITMLFSLLAYVVYFYLNTLVARWLGPALYGDFSVAIYLISLTGFVMLLGKNSSVVKYLPQYIHQKKWDFARGCLKQDIKLVTSIGGGIFVFGVIIALLLFPYLHGNFTIFNSSFTPYYHPFLLTIWIIPLFAFNLYLSQFILSLNRPVSSTFTNPKGIALQTVFSLFIILIYLINKNITFYHMFYAYAVALLFIIFFQLFILVIITPRNLINFKDTTKDKGWIKNSLYFLISSVVLILMGQISLLLLEALGHKENDVGILSAIFAATGICWVVLTATSQVFKPIIMPTLKSNDPSKNMQKLYFRANILLCGQAFLLTLILYVFRFKILGLFGDHFKHFGVQAYLIILPSIFVIIATGSASYFLQFSGKVVALIKLSGSALILQLILCLLLIPHYDLLGAAISFSLSEIVVCIGLVFVARKKMGLKFCWLF